MKSAIGELTDSTNRARGFSLIPIVWSAGSTIAYVVNFIIHVQLIQLVVL